MQHIFFDTFDGVLAYSRRDVAVARRLQNDLAANGIDTWLGDYLKPESDQWLTSIQAAMEQAQLLLVILTPRAISARGVRDAIRYALLNDITILPVLLEGDVALSQPPNIAHLTPVDLRDAFRTGSTLYQDDLRLALHQHEADQRRLQPYDPRDQFRLLRWILERPRNVSDYQKRLGSETLRKTAAWLSLSLVGVFFVMLLVLEMIRDYRPALWLGAVYIVGLYAMMAARPRLDIALVSYRWAAIAGVVLTMITVPLMILILPDTLGDLRPPGLDDLLVPIILLVVSSITLAIQETFENRNVLLPFLTFATAMTTAMNIVLSLGSTLARSINNELGTLGALTLIGSTISALTITVMYGLTFLIADDLITAIYTRGTVSRFGRNITKILPACYAALFLVKAL